MLSAMQGKDAVDSGRKRQQGRVLCLDGGGIRGLILVQVHLYAMQLNLMIKHSNVFFLIRIECII